MTITQLRYITAIKNYGSFTKAAEKCYIAQPTLTSQVKKLEQEIGVELFNRQNSPITATEAGEKYLKQAELVLAEASKLNSIFQQDGPLIGSIRIAIIPTIGTYLLPLIAQSLIEAHPMVKFYFIEIPTNQIIAMLEKDEIDLGIAATPIENNSLIEKPLYYEPFVLYSSEESNDEKVYDTETLNEFPLLILTTENCFRGQVLKICPKSSETMIECNSLETIMRLVDANMGITLIPEIYAKMNQSLNSKKVFTLQNPVPSREVSFLHKASFFKNALLEAVKAEILNHIDPEYKTQKDKSILGIENH